MTSNDQSDLGKATCSLRGRVVAGSYRTCVLTYTAGFAGIDDSGSIKVVMRDVTDAGTPQFQDAAAPHYTTTVASNGAQLQLRYDTKDNVRPWSKTIRIRVGQGYLRHGDKIVLTLGDRQGGSPGWRIQTFCETTFELRVLVDRYATCVYEHLAKSPWFRVVAGEPIKLVAVAPTSVRPGQKVTVRTKLEDRWGNPVGRPRKQIHPAFDKPGCYRIRVRDDRIKRTARTNPILVSADQAYGYFWADLHGQSEETIGTNTIDDYFRFGRDFAMLDACAHQGNDFQITDAFWNQIQETTRRYYEPGRFVTFPGWEWSGNTGTGGDRNVLFKEEGGVISRSCRVLVRSEDSAEPLSEHVEALFNRLEKSSRDVMTIAHVGGRYADLARHHEGLETAVEVHSAWGTFPWMLEDAFRYGYRVAIVGNSDGHKCRPGASHPGASTFGSYGGLTCVLAKKLDRDSVWKAYQSRRVYATTGARIALDVRTDSNELMGGVVRVGRDALPTIHVRVHGTAPIERVELLNAMTVLKTVRTYTAADMSNRVKILWQGAQVRGRGRQVNWDGGLRIQGNRIRRFSTVNFHNLERTCSQTGHNRLSWQSLTTGGIAGVIIELEKPAAGTLEVETTQKRFRLPIKPLGIRGRSYDLGGVGKRISAYRLPAAGGQRDLSFSVTPSWKQMRPGDNPLLVHVVQEDGHMAWSSPIYCVR